MKIHLYGIANLENRYEIVEHTYIEQELLSIKRLKHHAGWMLTNNAKVEYVYAVDDRVGLYNDYKAAKRKNSFVGFLTFRDMLEREGLKII